MKKCAAFLALSAVAAMFVAGAPQRAEARPQYLKAFLAKYDIAAANELKCGVCHGEGGKNKKVTSEYGQALFKALGGKEDGGVNCKDEAKIGASLGKCESEKPNGSGETFGEILKAGKLPPMAP